MGGMVGGGASAVVAALGTPGGAAVRAVGAAMEDAARSGGGTVQRLPAVYWRDIFAAGELAACAGPVYAGCPRRGGRIEAVRRWRRETTRFIIGGRIAAATRLQLSEHLLERHGGGRARSRSATQQNDKGGARP